MRAGPGAAAGSLAFGVGGSALGFLRSALHSPSNLHIYDILV